MTNFFDTIVPGDPNNWFPLEEYIRTHSPEQMVADIRSSKFDPNYLPDLGDMVKIRLKEKGRAYARLLYAEGIRQLEAAPELLTPDTNLFFAKRNFCACCIPDKPGEAFSVILFTPTLATADPALAALVAACLVEEGQFEDASVLFSAIDKIPLESLLRKLEDAGLSFDVVESSRAKIRMQLGTLKMGDLEWLVHSEAGQPPEGLLAMNMDELTKHGIPNEVLATIKTGVVLMASKDRKMWFCEFFDVSDPQPLLSRGIAGRFKADFHTRDGRHVNVFAVRHQ
jgi:hypothetical protein